MLLPCILQVKFDSAMAPLCSAYYRDNCEPPLTTKTASFAGTLDYIWVEPPISLHAIRHGSILWSPLFGIAGATHNK